MILAYQVVWYVNCLLVVIVDKYLSKISEYIVKVNENSFVIQILEAITTLRCCEDFSSERLELLGDSVLKYALSCHLYLKYPEKHEGQLSSRRSHVVCNAMLHKLGIDRKIQVH